MHICKAVLCAEVAFELSNMILTLRMQESDLQTLKIENLENDPCYQHHLHTPTETIFLYHRNI